MSEARRLKALEDENRRPKKLLAEAELDKAMLKEIASNGDLIYYEVHEGCGGVLDIDANGSNNPLTQTPVENVVAVRAGGGTGGGQPPYSRTVADTASKCAT